MSDEQVERPPTMAGSPLAAAERKLKIWIAVVVIGLIVIVVAVAALSGGDDKGDVIEDPLTSAECRSLQDDFDNQAEINEIAEPGSATFDRSLARMDAIDADLEDGGCYG